MSSRKQQSAASHTAWQPLFHFFATPVLLPYALYVTWGAIRAPSGATFLQAVVWMAVAAAVFASRLMALRVQDRVIRLEMRLRLREVLPAALVPRIGELTTRQLVALRFAGDAELPGLVERTLKGEFASQKAIKFAIKDWQADWLRC